MENKNKTLQEARVIFKKLKTNEKSVLCSEESLNIKLFNKLKRSKSSDDKELVKLIDVAANIEQFNNKKMSK